MSALVDDLREWAGQYLGTTYEGDRILMQAADRIEQLEAALEPFAIFAEREIGESESDEDRIGKLTVGDFRRALNAATRNSRICAPQQSALSAEREGDA